MLRRPPASRGRALADRLAQRFADRRNPRLLLVVVVAAAVAVPAAALRAACVAGSCHGTPKATLSVPFCAVPERARELLAAGYSEGASPDVIALTGPRPVVGSAGPGHAEPIRWPTSGGDEARVPLVLIGPGVRGGPLPSGTSLADVTPTVERPLGGAERRFPSGVRTGSALPVVAASSAPRLLLEVAWAGVGSEDLRARPSAWPYLHGLMRAGHTAGTLDATTGSLPADPAAVLTTLGTGSTPSEHGITGAFLRSPYTGDVVRAWRAGATPSSLPTLANDVLRRGHGAARAVLVTSESTDGGVVGGEFSVGSGRPRIRVEPGGAQGLVDASVRALRSARLGADDVPDLLVVVLRGPIAEMDSATRSIVRAARLEAGGSLLSVVTATGSSRGVGAGSGADATTASTIRHELARALGRDVVTAATPSGIFLRPGTSAQGASRALTRIRAGGHLVFDNAFPTFSLALAAFC
jgi:hypothetical protein